MLAAPDGNDGEIGNRHAAARRFSTARVELAAQPTAAAMLLVMQRHK